jgi:hypothetical protein
MIEISEIELTETELSDDQLQNISGACATGGLGGIHFGGGFGGFRGPRFGGFYGGGFGFGEGFSSFAPVQTIAFPVATDTNLHSHMPDRYEGNR